MTSVFQALCSTKESKVEVSRIDCSKSPTFPWRRTTYRLMAEFYGPPTWLVMASENLGEYKMSVGRGAGGFQIPNQSRSQGFSQHPSHGHFVISPVFRSSSRAWDKEKILVPGGNRTDDLPKTGQGVGRSIYWALQEPRWTRPCTSLATSSYFTTELKMFKICDLSLFTSIAIHLLSCRVYFFMIRWSFQNQMFWSGRQTPVSARRDEA